jgi:hypothetical protein
MLSSLLLYALARPAVAAQLKKIAAMTNNFDFIGGVLVRG